MVISFGELKRQQEVVIKTKNAETETTEFLSWLIWQRFNAAYGIVQLRDDWDETKFPENLAFLYASSSEWDKSRNRDELWDKWPRSKTKFGSYCQLGESGLDVARLFGDSIHGAAEITKVFEFSRFDTHEFGIDELKRWHCALHHELNNTTLLLATWPRAIFRRDYDLVCHKVNEEYQSLFSTAPTLSATITVPMLWNLVQGKRLDNGELIADSEKTVRGWTYSVDFPKSVNPRAKRNIPRNWEAVRAWVNTNKGLDIGPQCTNTELR